MHILGQLEHVKIRQKELSPPDVSSPDNSPLLAFNSSGLCLEELRL